MHACAFYDPRKTYLRRLIRTDRTQIEKANGDNLVPRRSLALSRDRFCEKRVTLVADESRL